MTEVSEAEYLGNVVSSDGKPDLDIDCRYSKGISAANQILVMINESFSFNYFEVAILFRNSILINEMLCSVESLNYLNKCHIEKLESCDKYLMTKLFQTGPSCPTNGFFFETGALPLRYVIMGRFLTFLWSILNKNESELAKQVYEI